MLVAVCTDTVDGLPDGVWLCGTSRTIECGAPNGTASPREIYVVPRAGCANGSLVVDQGPFGLGEHELIVRSIAPGATLGDEVCRSRLTVVDTTPPRGHSQRTTLWPPNHQLHTITARECAGAVDACDPDLEVHFTSASSDEPVDANGDGHHGPDIAFSGAGEVSLRAERQGPSNGRVYTLSWVARDAAGNSSTGACTVAVPHDESGRTAIADAPSYSVPAPAPP